MPTYDYKCNACSHAFEHFQSMKDGPLRKCPKCGKLALERLIGIGAAVLFKGSGFYQTDYRSDSYNAAQKADSGGAKPDTAGASGGESGDKGTKPATSESATAAPSPSPPVAKPADSKPQGEKPKGTKKPKP